MRSYKFWRKAWTYASGKTHKIGNAVHFSKAHFYRNQLV
jgi:hypothetical protein